MAEAAAAPSPGLWRAAGRRLKAQRATALAALGLAVLVALALFGPAFSVHHYDELDWQHLGQPPGMLGAHWFGTDRLGRDLYVRALYGLRLSLLVSVLASAV